MKHILLLLILISAISCNQNSVVNNSADSAVAQENDSLVSIQSPPQIIEFGTALRQVVALNDHFNVQLIGEYSANGLVDSVRYFTNDTLLVEVEYSLDPVDLSFKLSNVLLDNIRVEQCMQTSVTIMNEGPHCDMTNWLHHTTEWHTISENDSGYYVLKNYNEKDCKKFPDVSVNQLKEAARKYCGDEWANTINSIQNINEYPCEVGMNKVIVRISGINKENGKEVVNYIALIFSMGC